MEHPAMTVPARLVTPGGGGPPGAADVPGDSTVPGTGAAPRVAAAFSGGVPFSALVIGAGVSGCACAATLASAGVHVTLINSSMDRVGFPAYGPDLIGVGGQCSQLEVTMAALPSPLRAIWLEAAMRPVCGGALLNVDRRRVSVETKRLLEHVPGLHFRQGFVVDLRLVPPAGEGQPVTVQAETTFGEVFEADAVVVAAGLSLDGRSLVGGDTVEGGRYGEPASDELLGALRTLGAEFREVVLQVGARSAAADFRELEEAALERAGLRLAAPHGAAPNEGAPQEVTSGLARDDGPAMAETELLVVTEGEAEWAWPADYPPAPHRDPAFRLKKMLVAFQKDDDGQGSLAARYRPVVSPDGAATSEVYVAPDGVAADAAEDGRFWGAVAVETRMPLKVTASVITNITPSGRLVDPRARGRIWVVGRSAGADDYVDSLASGVRAGLDVAAALGGGGDAG